VLLFDLLYRRCFLFNMMVDRGFFLPLLLGLAELEELRVEGGGVVVREDFEVEKFRKVCCGGSEEVSQSLDMRFGEY